MKHSHLFAAGLLIAAAPAPAQSVKSGIEAWQHSDYVGAVKIWRPLAEKGDPDAQFNLAQAYRLGRGVPVNLAAAQTWLQRSASQGHIDAQTTLGLLLFQGGNRTAGIRWLKGAADKNEPRAMLVYGTALFNGDSIKQDSALGYSYVKRAADQGLGPARDTLAQMDRTMSAADRARFARLPATKVAAKTTAPAKAAAKLADKTTASAKPASKPVDKAIVSAKPAAKAEKAVAAERPPHATAAPTAEAKHTTVAQPASGGWRVQLGAFSQRGSAEALFRKLSGSGPLAGHSPSYVSAGAVTRLQVGPFASKAAAGDACRALSARGQACFAVPAK